jgi:UDP-N-acetylmuramate dehydrogenase
LGDRLSHVAIFAPGSESRRLEAGELEVRYRRIVLPAGAVVEHACLRLDASDPESVSERQKEVLEAKWKSQPVGMRSAGCIFRNPPGESAGKLIDSCGLKGTRVGGAVISDIHANYILNDRGATPDDVEELIDLVRTRVLEDAGVELDLEVEILGRDGQ